ncbi:hypothetical protein [Sandaracinobacteroides saxicola]|uniref:Uncharacterized protein n=1 Tax=Sandaracinobacteroides saxicola TaxID=2759707 RepID=A0A7G5IL16_9SPHN|nr:hypothetical protein [Sandaracinobacteroides saxicola]QMW24058.1 hypothetical protein H3309_06240 [Sandaracinobacteroides saxicola]
MTQSDPTPPPAPSRDLVLQSPDFPVPLATTQEEARDALDTYELTQDTRSWAGVLDFEPRFHPNGWDRATQLAFLAAVYETGSIVSACRKLGRSVSSAYALRSDPRARIFATAWDAAIALSRRHLLETAFERAVQGTPKPITRHGKVIGHFRRPDNALLMKLIVHLDKAPDARAFRLTTEGYSMTNQGDTYGRTLDPGLLWAWATNMLASENPAGFPEADAE